MRPNNIYDAIWKRAENDLIRVNFPNLKQKQKGQRWRSRRRLLTPAFHFQILENFFDVFNDQSHQLIKELETAADSCPKVDGSVNVYKILTQCALDIICGWPIFLFFKIFGWLFFVSLFTAFVVIIITVKKKKLLFLMSGVIVSVYAYAPYEKKKLACVLDSSMGRQVRKREETAGYLHSINR